MLILVRFAALCLFALTTLFISPIDARLSCDLDNDSRVFEMEKIMRAVEGVPKQVLVFNACRDDSFQARCPGRTGTGFDRASLPVGAIAAAASVIVAYSTGDGADGADGADDGDKGHSPFAKVLLTEMRDPDKQCFVTNVPPVPEWCIALKKWPYHNGPLRSRNRTATTPPTSAPPQ